MNWLFEGVEERQCSEALVALVPTLFYEYFSVYLYANINIHK